MSLFRAELDALTQIEPLGITGRVASVRGLSLLATELPVPIGSLVEIGAEHGSSIITGEVVGFEGPHTIIMLLADTTGIVPGAPIRLRQVFQAAPVSRRMLGRVVNGLGQPIDDLGPISESVNRPINPAPIGPMNRKRIEQQLLTGVRAIDLMTPMGRGQRLGIFAGPGVGKSTLLGQIARATDADVNVIALIGERGREVLDFIHHSLGEEGLARSVVIVATSDESPLLRIRAAKLATTAAEFFRDRGDDVLLMMDSVTRFAMAQREIGLALGEPPTTKGYTPSVFTLLPKLMERAGTSATRGSITGLYTVLVEGDDTNEPIADAIRSILDGHIVLTRELAMQGHYPAIDVPRSISRVMDDIVSEDHRICARKLKSILATYRRAEDLINIGAYAAGSNPDIDHAIQMIAGINAYLRQDVDTTVSLEESVAALTALFD